MSDLQLILCILAPLVTLAVGYSFGKRAQITELGAIHYLNAQHKQLVGHYLALQQNPNSAKPTQLMTIAQKFHSIDDDQAKNLVDTATLHANRNQPNAPGTNRP